MQGWGVALMRRGAMDLASTTRSPQHAPRCFHLVRWWGWGVVARLGGYGYPIQMREVRLRSGSGRQIRRANRELPGMPRANSDRCLSTGQTQPYQKADKASNRTRSIDVETFSGEARKVPDFRRMHAFPRFVYDHLDLQHIYRSIDIRVDKSPNNWSKRNGISGGHRPAYFYWLFVDRDLPLGGLAGPRPFLTDRHGQAHATALIKKGVPIGCVTTTAGTTDVPKGPVAMAFTPPIHALTRASESFVGRFSARVSLEIRRREAACVLNPVGSIYRVAES